MRCGCCLNCDACKRSIKRMFLLLSLYGAAGYAYSSGLLSERRGGTDEEVIQNIFSSAFANGLFSSSLGAQFCDELSGILKIFSERCRENAIKFLFGVVSLVPASYAVVSRISLNYDSMRDDRSLAAYATIFTPSMIYAVFSSFVGVYLLLNCRLFMNLMHFVNLVKPEYWQFYRLIEVLKLRERELKEIEQRNGSLILSFDQLDQSLSLLLSRLETHQLKRSRSENLVQHVIRLFTIASVLVVIAVVPPIFMHLSARGFNELSTRESFRAWLGWSFREGEAWGDNHFAVLMSAFATTALYLVSALNYLELTQKFFWNAYFCVKRHIPGILAGGSVIAGLGALYYVGARSGMGMRFEMEKTLLCNATHENMTLANTTLPPAATYACFGAVAEQIFFSNFIFLTLFKIVDAIMGAPAAIMLAAGDMANLRGMLVWGFGIASLMNTANTFFETIQSFFAALLISIGLWEKPHTENPDLLTAKQLHEKLQNVLVYSKVDANGSLLLNGGEASLNSETICRALGDDGSSSCVSRVVASMSSLVNSLLLWFPGNGKGKRGKDSEENMTSPMVVVHTGNYGAAE